MARLRSGSGGLNGATKLTGAILDDLAVDTQVGGRGQDWFFARVASSPDLHSDRATNELIN